MNSFINPSVKQFPDEEEKTNGQGSPRRVYTGLMHQVLLWPQSKS
jgi:hypothetical protein